MTDLPTYAEMMAVADRRKAWEEAAKSRDGFWLGPWTEDGDVYGCLGHVDRQRFLDQYRALCTYLLCAPDMAEGVSVAQVEHRYVLIETDEYGDGMMRWAVPDETKPQTYTHVQTRAVTADDPGAEPVTMLDL